MYGQMLPFLLMYGSHDMRHTGFRRLTVVNGTPEDWGVTKSPKTVLRNSQESLRKKKSEATKKEV